MRSQAKRSPTLCIAKYSGLDFWLSQRPEADALTIFHVAKSGAVPPFFSPGTRRGAARFL
ncbi:hypothetical protein KL86DES1_21342 [uncultured Desulfovibrio sp.]|uniref:Uncharacterized protein n=1 Tax=uncultured Desulfovibrio sp. TaxID=167968 RepID=A0A212L7K9_9BACT|nr:hypothetical protein KL86DES1_21342 [uncultured Desulfovibrio sp.]VZH34241.1 conserved protein of unknown function [Desulfovibrio sp. 86]